MRDESRDDLAEDIQDDLHRFNMKTAFAVFALAIRTTVAAVPTLLAADDEAAQDRSAQYKQLQQQIGVHSPAATASNQNISARNFLASNTAKSSILSPVPTKRVGIPSSSWIATTMPPLPLPSSFVTMTPVSVKALWNSRA